MNADMNKPLIMKTADGKFAAMIPGDETRKPFDTWKEARTYINERTATVVTDPIGCIVSSALREHFPDRMVEDDQIVKAIDLLAMCIFRNDPKEARIVAETVSE